jgi:hypothetical protein
MRSIFIAVLALSLTLVSCGQKIRGTYRCVFNCACKDRNIIHEMEFTGSRSVVISDGVDKKTLEYRVRDKRIELEDGERRGSIVILNNHTIIIQGKDCLSGTYRKIL